MMIVLVEVAKSIKTVVENNKQAFINKGFYSAIKS